MLSLVTDRNAVENLRYKSKDDYDWYVAQNGVALAAEDGAILTVLYADIVKGGYGPEDLNRVGAAIQYIAGLLSSYGYAITVTARTDWTYSDYATYSPMTAYLSDITAIKNKFYGTTALPSAMDNLGFTDANNIEKLLLEVEKYINDMIAAFRYSGDFYCGE